MSATGGIDRNLTHGASRLRRIGTNIAKTAALLVRPPLGATRRRRPNAAAMIGGAAMIIATILAAMLWLDGRVIAGVAGLPSWLVRGFEEITDFGRSGWFLWPIGLLLVAMAVASARELPRVARLVLAALTMRLVFLFVAIALPGLIVTVLKRLIGRARPLVSGDGDVFVFKPFIWRVDFAGMPSGHGTTAFAAAIAIGALWPWTRPLMWTYAALIAISRVVVTAHYPSDVIASAAFGIVGALLVRDWFAARRLGFAVDSDGAVRRLPGPSFRRTKAVARRLLSA